MTAAPLLGEPLPVELMNTIWADHGGVHDELEQPDAAMAWLRAVHPRLDRAPVSVREWLTEPSPAGAVDTARDLRRLRDALRRLAALVTEDPRSGAASRIEDPAGALAVLNHACAHAPTWSQLDWSQLDWSPDWRPTRRALTTGSAGQVAVSILAESAVELFAGDGRDRLRACLAPGCVLYFIAHPARREWCSSGCGNRARVARHYRRRRPPVAEGEIYSTND
jgi:predicted RNA-binding Zn ribbon-like protein